MYYGQAAAGGLLDLERPRDLTHRKSVADQEVEKIGTLDDLEDAGVIVAIEMPVPDSPASMLCTNGIKAAHQRIRLCPMEIAQPDR